MTEHEISLKEHFDSVINSFKAQSTREHDEVKDRLGKLEISVDGVHDSLVKGGERMGAIEQELAATRAVKDDRSERSANDRSWIGTATATVAVFVSIAAIYFSSISKNYAEAAKQDTGQAAEAAVVACQATQDLRTRSLTGLITSLSKGNITQHYYNLAVGQLPPKVDCSNQ